MMRVHDDGETKREETVKSSCYIHRGWDPHWALVTNVDDTTTGLVEGEREGEGEGGRRRRRWRRRGRRRWRK